MRYFITSDLHLSQATYEKLKKHMNDIITFGMPFGHLHSVSSGILSGKTMSNLGGGPYTDFSPWGKSQWVDKDSGLLSIDWRDLTLVSFSKMYAIIKRMNGERITKVMRRRISIEGDKLIINDGGKSVTAPRELMVHYKQWIAHKILEGDD